MYIGGLDIGTTGCKLTVFDETGKQLDKAYLDYPVKRIAGAHEVDANAILESVYGVISGMAARYPEIAGIGVTSFGETFVLADGAGHPLCPSMLYTDPRGSEECRKLRDALGSQRIAEISGVNPHEMYSLPKLMWLKEQKPELYEKAEHVFLMEDFVIFHLTGQARIDYSLAARTMGFDIRKLCWSREIFEAAAIDMGLMSSPVPTGTIAGAVTESAARRTGLDKQTKIVCVSHDQIAAAVGAGVFEPDTAVDGAGTVECVTPVFDGIPDMEIMAKGNYAVVPYVIPGKYVCYAFSYTGGALIQWCTDTLAKKEKELARAQGISVNEFLEREYEGRAGETDTIQNAGSGLMVLPHFAGAATPYMDTDARGAILGLTMNSSVADIYRACMEGVAFEMRLNVEYLRSSGIHFKALYASGGGARSEIWMQMKADILNLPITALETADAGTVGSAMLTGVALSCFADLREAARMMVRPIKTYCPREKETHAYQKIYEKYAKIYETIRPLL